MKNVILMLTLALAGCGQGSTPPMPPSSPVSGPETMLVSQPATVATYSNAAPPKGTVGAILWGPVEKLPSPPTDATSVNGVLDIVIDSASMPGNVAARRGLATIVLAYDFKSPYPRAPQYRYTYDLRVPRADHSGASVAQVVAYYNLHDRVSGARLWLGQIAFDTRCGKGGDIAWDQGTNTPMYNVLSPGFSCTPFSEWRSYSFTAGAAEIGAAATALRARYPSLRLSSNMSDYELTHINLNPETANGTARIDVGVTKWQITKQEKAQ